MTKILDVMPYAKGCESRRYIGCFASLSMCMEHNDGTEPVFCTGRKDVCVDCGDCDNSDLRRRAHEQIYYLFLAVSGMSALYFDLDRPSKDHDSIAHSLVPDAVEATMGYAGYVYDTLTSEAGTDVVRSAIVSSIDNGIPVIVRTTQGSHNIIAGYAEDGLVLYGFNGHGTYLGALTEPDGYTDSGMFHSRDWMKDLTYALIVTGKTPPTIGFRDVFERLIGIFESQLSVGCGDMLFRVLADDGRCASMNETELRALYGFTNGLIGYLAEARYFMHDAFAGALGGAITKPEIRQIGYEIDRLCLDSHDMAWVPWRAIGAWEEGDHTERLRDAAIRQGVTDGLKHIIENDRQALARLKQGVVMI